MNSSKPKRQERSFENCLLQRSSLFCVKRLVTFGKTNALGGAYFAEFFAWTGEAREELLAKMGKIESITPHTSEAHMKYFRELLPLEEFEIIVWPRANRMSLSLRFFFVRDKEFIAVGDQEICLKMNNQLVPIPATIVCFIGQFDPD